MLLWIVDCYHSTGDSYKRGRTDFWSVDKIGSTPYFSYFWTCYRDPCVGSNGALRIGFTLTQADDGHQATSAEINLYSEKPGLGNHSSSNDGAKDIIITDAVHSGDMLRLPGTSTGTLPFRKFFSRDIDITDAIKVKNGKIDVTILSLQNME